MISILMAVKNGWKYFPASLASVLEQEHVDWELLVGVNGHPANGKVFQQVHGWKGDIWARSQTAQNAYVIDLPGCQNKPAALNYMAGLARGTYVAILDVDDLWHPWKLAKQLAYLRDYDVVGTMGEYFGTESGLIDVPCGPISFDDMMEKNCLLNSSVVMKREHARWPDTDGLDDYPLWLELASQGKRLMNIGGEPLVKIRCHPEQHFPSRDDSHAIRERYRAQRTP
jgi:glycosyltransferase involved in cell wall biosynthesis